MTTSVTTLIGRTLRVGCEPDRGAIDSCAVTVFARVRGDRGRLPRLPRRHGLAMIAAGRARSDGVVRIRMPRRARLLVNRRGGILVRMRLRARAFDGRTLTAIRRVRLLPRRRLVAATDRLFLSGGAVALPGGRRYLRRIALELAGARRVVCIGHTDGVGSAALNRLLGRARAAAVCRGLRRAGLRAKFRARSRGEAQPRATNRTAHGRALNRRVDLLVRY